MALLLRLGARQERHGTGEILEDASEMGVESHYVLEDLREEL
jgi:hypothetical protein